MFPPTFFWFLLVASCFSISVKHSSCHVSGSFFARGVPRKGVAQEVGNTIWQNDTLTGQLRSHQICVRKQAKAGKQIESMSHERNTRDCLRDLCIHVFQVGAPLGHTLDHRDLSLSNPFAWVVIALVGFVFSCTKLSDTATLPGPMSVCRGVFIK